MAFDGLVLHQLNTQLNINFPAKLLKIQQISDDELLFHVRTQNGNKRLMISLHSVYNRIHFSEENYTTVETPSNFVMVLRKQIDGGIIKSLTQVGLDRVLHMVIEARDDLGDIHLKHFYIELMGKYANIVLVDEDDKIIDVLKRIPPFENSRRTLLPGVKYHLPQPHEGKQDPFNHGSFSLDETLTKQFHGFSPLLSKEVLYRIHNGEDFDNIMDQIKNSDSLYISDVKDQMFFHCIPLTHLEVEPRVYPIMKGMDILYYEKEEKVRIKQQSGDLFRAVRKEKNKNTSKLPKLIASLSEAMDCDQYREFGDLLFAYMYQVEKQPTITLTSFETGEDVHIPIDMRYDLKFNANRYYQKYHKLKRAQTILKEQIELCEQEIRYFDSLEIQLEQASIQDAMEIREELAKQNYIKPIKTKIRKKKKQTLPHFETFKFDDIYVYVGKNNIQNDFVTWHLGRKQDTWLHVKDLHGSHVIITTDHPDETLLRNASMLAAWYSQGRYSSSVPVNYCLVRQLKKIPGNKGSFVSLSNYKTIYIDPDASHIQKLMDEHLVK